MKRHVWVVEEQKDDGTFVPDMTCHPDKAGADWALVVMSEQYPNIKFRITKYEAVR